MDGKRRKESIQYGKEDIWVWSWGSSWSILNVEDKMFLGVEQWTTVMEAYFGEKDVENTVS